MKNFFLLSTLFLSVFFSHAQERTFYVLGKVVDSASNQPLSGASIFAQNTTYGTISNNEGNFFIRLPYGGYDLIVSYTGYNKKVLRISNNNSTSDTITIQLPQEEKTLTEVAVVASNEVRDGWIKYGKFFSDNFIGTTPNANQCIIQNPEALRFFYTKKRNRLKVTSKAPLMVINNGLGYKIHYQLDSFSYDYNTNISQYTGYPFFEEIDTSGDVRTSWNKNRARAYLGSRLHFMQAYYDSIVTEEGFVVEKLDDSGKSIKGTQIADLYDTDIYFKDSNQVEINWRGRYRIAYKNVLPDKQFLSEFKLPANTRMQVTLLDITDGFVIEENGYFYEQYDVINTGYWAWKKLADLLPYDYEFE